MLKVFLPIPTKPTFRSDSLMPFTADLILAERDDITQRSAALDGLTKRERRIPPTADIHWRDIHARFGP
jgi:hypothetical protein